MTAFHQRIVARAVALSLAVALCGCGESGDGTVERIEVVRANLPQDPASLSLVGKVDRYSEIVAAQVTDSLVNFDPALSFVPSVAASWELSDGGREVTFRLREGVRWHDGREVTAEDVLFTVRQVRDPTVENPTFSPHFADLETIEAPDPRTVRARFARPRPDLLEAWRVPLVPSHLAEEGAAILTGEFARHPVGCGPFRFVRYLRGEEIVLEANDDYWNGRPEIDRLVFRIFPHDRTAFEALLAGEIDWLATSPELWTLARESEGAERLASYVYYRLVVWQVSWNHRRPPFGDPDVRRALTLAVDRRRFIENVLYGLGRPAVTSYHPDLRWTDPAVEPWPYDPVEAARLLERAGWIDEDGDGVRERDGVPLRFDLIIHASSQAMTDQLAAWLQQSWAEIGAAARIDRLEWNLFRERRNAGEYDGAMYGISFTPTPDQWELYHSTATWPNGQNYAHLSDPEVDRLLEAGRHSFDEAERRRIYYELQRRLHELEPLSYILHLATPVLHHRRLAGIEPSPLDEWRHTRGPRVWHWLDDED
jgi:peptide/nickel transport system substrate-binding protein